MKGLTLTTREQSRIQVLNGVIERKVSMAEAAELMRVSERHAWRLLATYRKEGAAGVAHGNRGRRPSTATSPETQEQVTALAKGRYAGFNHSHLTELLAEREGVRLSRSTVRRVLLAGGVRSPRRRRARKRYLRGERYPQEGMLLQIDGSRHDWLEGRGPRLTLIGAVDDATGTVPFALFREQEDAHGYLLMLQEVERRDEQLQGRREPTQFARALEELGITLIMAHTPQARVAWSARGTPSKTDWSRRCASRARRPSRRPTGCSGTSCRDTIGSSAWRRPSRNRPIAHCRRASPLMRSCASSTWRRGQRQHHPLQRRRAAGAPRWAQDQLRSDPRRSPRAAGRQHRGRPPGQDRGHRAGPRRARRA